MSQYNLTKDEAIKAMKKGKKVTHKYFSENEWMVMSPSGFYEFEDGYSISPSEFWGTRNDKEVWETGWKIIK